MIRISDNRKVTEKHLSKKAYLYVRQSTIRQVYENPESTERQYALRQKAVDLGWADDQIEVIDNDLGLSAASQIDREGFKKLVGEIGMGHGGLVMGLEVSRLARSCIDWHKLLEICALSETLILDEDGIYDPTQYNDRLLLGLKGSMSEAELHILKARLQGGLINKAQKGELYKRLPIGYVHNEEGKIIKDPDIQVQRVVNLMFNTFKRIGSANRTSKYFYQKKIKFPQRQYSGPDKGNLVWKYLTTTRIIYILHNPCYAGAYVFGRRRVRKGGPGRIIVKAVSQDQWHAFIPSAHKGYISWGQYLENQKMLSKNTGSQNNKTTIREGNALLQGIAVCGKCGKYMFVRYHKQKKGLVPGYFCDGLEKKYGGKNCQAVNGGPVDEVISKLLIELMQPSVLEVSLNVQKEMESRLEEVEKLFKQQVIRAQYEEGLARRRYMQADPDNRLVAGTLENQWNAKLKLLKQAEEEYQKKMQEKQQRLEEDTAKQIMKLTTDFPEFWNDKRIENRERKRLVRLMIEDVTLIQNKQIKIQIRFKGGAVKTIEIPKPSSSAELVKTKQEVIGEVDELLNNHTYVEVAVILNNKGLKTGVENNFTERSVKHIRNRYKLKTRTKRMRERGLLTLTELAKIYGHDRQTIKNRIEKGILKIKRYQMDDRNPPNYMYENPNKIQESTTRTQEVQYE